MSASSQSAASQPRRRISDRMGQPDGPLSYDGKPDWLDQLLADAEKLTHKSPTLVRALTMFKEPILSHRRAYAEFLDHTLRVAQCFNRLLFQFGGVPLETELRSVYREAWAFIHGGSLGDETVTVVFFEVGGIALERSFATPEAALNVLVDDGYVLPDRDALFRVSTEHKWPGGGQSVAVAAVSSLDGRQIDEMGPLNGSTGECASRAAG